MSRTCTIVRATPSRASRVVAAVVTGVAFLLVVLVATPAYALVTDTESARAGEIAPAASLPPRCQVADTTSPNYGQPFDPADPTVFIAQNLPTCMYTSTQSAGKLTLNGEGFMTKMYYNAIGFNAVDNYIYGIKAQADSSKTNGTNILVRIGQGGAVTELGEVAGLPKPVTKGAGNGTVGNSYTQGAFGNTPSAAGVLYVRDYKNSDNYLKMWAVDVATVSATEIAFAPDSTPIKAVADFTWANARMGEPYQDTEFLYGVSDAGIYEIAEVRGTWYSYLIEDVVPEMRGTHIGAAWTLGNGVMGFSDNTTGEVFFVEKLSGINFELIARFEGPATKNNDGTNIQGLPLDLGIKKTGPEFYYLGEQLDYALTITNHSEVATSSGSVVTDLLPENMDFIARSDYAGQGCTTYGRRLVCVLGRLGPGEEAVVQLSAQVNERISYMNGVVLNHALVRGNEAETNPNNNEAFWYTRPLPGAVTVTKSSNPVTGENVRVGQYIDYTLTFESTTRAPVTVDHEDILTDVLDDADLVGVVSAEAPLAAALTPAGAPDRIHITGELPGKAGDNASNPSARVTYRVQVNDPLPDAASGVLRNFVVTTGATPPPGCDATTLLCTEHPVIGDLSWNKVDGATPANLLAGAEWKLTPYGKTAVGEPTNLLTDRAMTVTDCVEPAEVDCAGPDRDPATGKFKVSELPVGTYQLEETRAPAGFHKIDPIDIKINGTVAHGDIVNVQVTGPEIPLTGGIGTVLFAGLAGGSGLIVAAIVLWQRQRSRAARVVHAG